MKKLYSYFFTSLVGTIVFLTCLFLIWGKERNGITGVFQIAGERVLDQNFDRIVSKGNEILHEIENTDAPEVIYSGNTYCVGVETNLKSMIKVKLPDALDYVSGDMEKGFSVVINGLYDHNYRKIEPVSIEDEEASDEIRKDVYYQLESGRAIFHEEGIYRIALKVYGANGRYASKVIKIIVEAL